MEHSHVGSVDESEQVAQSHDRHVVDIHLSGQAFRCGEVELDRLGVDTRKGVCMLGAGNLALLVGPDDFQPFHYRFRLGIIGGEGVSMHRVDELVDVLARNISLLLSAIGWAEHERMIEAE